jgi:hypothetical protein
MEEQAPARSAARTARDDGVGSGQEQTRIQIALLNGSKSAS